MRFTAGFTEDAPQHELEGMIAATLTDRFLPRAERIGATRSLITRDEFLKAVDDAGTGGTIGAELATFIEHVRGEGEELMVQLKWWD